MQFFIDNFFYHKFCDQIIVTAHACSRNRASSTCIITEYFQNENVFLLIALCRSTVGSSGRVMTTHATVLPGQVNTIIEVIFRNLETVCVT